MSIPRGKRYLGVASQARIKFQDSSDDVRSFNTLRQMLKGRKAANKHLNRVAKGVYVLVAAQWEAYCEDLAVEAATLIVERSPSWEHLPTGMSQKIARELKDNKHHLSPWQLAGNGWRTYCLARLPAVTGAAQINTPKPAQIDALFHSAIGLRGLSSAWTVTADGADPRDRLREFIELRGSIAHGGTPPVQVTAKLISDFYQAVMRLVEETDEAVRAFIESTVGFTPWQVPDGTFLKGMDADFAGEALVGLE